jgi:hypothetical protein
MTLTGAAIWFRATLSIRHVIAVLVPGMDAEQLACPQVLLLAGVCVGDLWNGAGCCGPSGPGRLIWRFPMDPLLSGLLVRFFERITVVLIGGMAVYLGFRLFREVPEHRDSAGKLVLPWDISIVLTRVGPGIFFALFGVVAVSLALVRPLEIQPEQKENKGGTENKGGEARLIYVNPTPENRDARVDGRKSLQKTFAALNDLLPSLRQDLREVDRDLIKTTIDEIKLKLMRPFWGDQAEGFGDFGQFENWVKNGNPNSPPEGMEGALKLYRYKN